MRMHNPCVRVSSQPLKRTGHAAHLSGFTIIELMVSISIIAVLLGFLFPALASAREAGRRARCLANLHNFGLAFEMYGSDHHPEPFPFAAENFSALMGWNDPLTALAPYLGVPVPTFDTAKKRVVNVSEVLICPSDPGDWRLDGWSYYYFPTEMMQFPKDLLAKAAPQYRSLHSSSDALPVLLDGGPWHNGPTIQQRQNALRFDGGAGVWTAR